MKIINWFFDLFNTNKTYIVKYSLTGEPLIEINEGICGVGISSTKSGIMRANILVSCTQTHDYNVIMKVIKRECDKYLTQEDKDRVLELFTRSEPVNYTWNTKRNLKGNLEFRKLYWTNDQIKELHKYLEKI